MEVKIKASHLKAAACFSGEGDLREYLNGVFVEVCVFEIRLTATNGHVIGVLRDKENAGDYPDMPAIIIPNYTVLTALSQKTPFYSLSFLEDKWSLNGIAFTPIPSKCYPDYRRGIPGRHSGVGAQFNLRLLARFDKAAKALGIKSNPIIRHNGDGAAQVQFDGFDAEFVGAIAPLRIFTRKEPDPGLVQWGSERV